MTTGRINQVTILGQWDSLGNLVKKVRAEAQPHTSPRTKSTGRLNGHPFATTELPSIASVEESAFQHETSTWPPPGRVTRRRSRSVKNGYRYTSIPPIASFDRWPTAINPQHPRLRNLNQYKEPAWDTSTTPTEGSNDCRRLGLMRQ